MSEVTFPNVFSTDEQILRDQLRSLEAATVPPSGTDFDIPSFPSTCGCGDGCRCPGCVHHNLDATPASSAFSPCMNPGACSTCLDCTILSLPASLPPDTSLSIHDAYQTVSIDEWIRQVSSLPPSSPSIPTPPNGDPTIVMQSSQTDQQPLWDGYLTSVTDPMPPDSSAFGCSVQPCCHALCKCQPENCECEIESEVGYDCRREVLIPTFPHDSAVLQSYPQTHATNEPVEDDVVSRLGQHRNDSQVGIYFDTSTEPGGQGYLGISESPRSRSSSTSSSSHSSRGLPSQLHHSSPFSTRPLVSDYSFAGQPPGRVFGPFYASSPNLGLTLQPSAKRLLPLSGGSSPASGGSSQGIPGIMGAYGNGNVREAKHPHKPVNGVLLGKKAGSAVVIEDAVPLLHHWTTLSPMMEIGLDLAAQYAESINLKLVGFYQASERLDDTSLVPIGEKVVEKVKAGFSDAVAFVIDGDKLGSDEAALIPYVSSTSSTWRPYSGDALPFGKNSAFQLASENLPRRAVALVRDDRLHQKFGDFDDHLEDVAIGKDHIFDLEDAFKSLYPNSSLVDALQFEIVRCPGDPNGIQCILTITRPEGASRVYESQPCHSEDSHTAKLQVGRIAVEKGALDFILYGEVEMKEAHSNKVEDGDGDASVDNHTCAAEGHEDQHVLDIERACLEHLPSSRPPEWIMYRTSDYEETLCKYSSTLLSSIRPFHS
ncbi:hypothetical protein DXG03_007565 [Asterophora parasitica]|uniref:MPN domain-containing protein n=1 Tax=Asterophora parasitica TaxID=117018 RepID=A0A9P7G9W6_9AGAR|nr:hypothetical protein DXG03_007565 [Asterophora parasitica]